MELFVMLCAVLIDVVLGASAITDAVHEEKPER